MKLPREGKTPLSKRDMLERIAGDERYYFRHHPDEVDAVRATPEYQQQVEKLRIGAGQVPEGHWAHGRPAHVYVDLMSDAYVWAKLVK